MKTKNYYSLAFISPDKTGIVAGVSKVLYDNGFNIDDSSSIYISGIFTMILVVSHKNELTVNDICLLFKETGYTPQVNIIPETYIEADGESYSISVYGADKAGIVYKVTKFLAEQKINIIELQTKVVGKDSDEIYVMILEIIVPTDLSDSWEMKLLEVVKEMNIDIKINKIDSYEF